MATIVVKFFLTAFMVKLYKALTVFSCLLLFLSCNSDRSTDSVTARSEYNVASGNGSYDERQIADISFNDPALTSFLVPPERGSIL